VQFPGVRHTALLHMKERGDLQLVAQERATTSTWPPAAAARPPAAIAAARCVPAADGGGARRTGAAGCAGKVGRSGTGDALHDRNVRMVLALPLRAEPGGPEIGAICLMFDRHIMFSREQFACFASLAQFVSFGMGMSELKHQNDALSGQLSQMSTVDAVTGAANRRAGEDNLDNEIRRAPLRPAAGGADLRRRQLPFVK
jgi:hypothetical protein